MGCEHEHLRTVGDRLFCKDCGKELPIEFLTQGEPVQEKPKKAPAKKAPAKKAPAKKKGE